MVDEFTPSMFNGNGEPSVYVTRQNPRQPQIDRAFEKAEQAFLDQYENFLLTTAAFHPGFIAGEITEAYVKRHGAISIKQKKALGGLYQRLMNRGLIEKTGGYRARNQGNPSAIYKLNRVTNDA